MSETTFTSLGIDFSEVTSWCDDPGLISKAWFAIPGGDEGMLRWFLAEDQTISDWSFSTFPVGGVMDLPHQLGARRDSTSDPRAQDHWRSARGRGCHPCIRPFVLGVAVKHDHMMDHRAISRSHFRRLNPHILFEIRLSAEMLITDCPRCRDRVLLRHFEDNVRFPDSPAVDVFATRGQFLIVAPRRPMIDPGDERIDLFLTDLPFVRETCRVVGLPPTAACVFRPPLP